MQTEVQRRIQRLDQARCDAMLGEDYERLASLLSDDLLFVHSNGYAHDKAGYLAFLAEKVRTLDIHRPSAPAFKHVGAAILVCGPLDQILERRAEGQRIEVRSYTTQIWRPFGVAWQLLHQHSTRRAE
ncbi:DUF4440 domain-containing protein [uncultured Ralstonia sp.]|jgi:hypothetical protein|uniref:DUF4440 domain-containing protein n=1 Tax=uncultured Ralstonia sp. TaxID=114715 RepID=UPI0025DA2358|nr:DUF4440 domain-containing protein [uncultured Ralstonia sp.]